jgi:hypothetical protein
MLTSDPRKVPEKVQWKKVRPQKKFSERLEICFGKALFGIIFDKFFAEIFLHL